MKQSDINLYFDITSNSWVLKIKIVGGDWVTFGNFPSKQLAENSI